ncbi:hypothetical protein Tco_0314328 [Tanacetum coccineum]
MVQPWERVARQKITQSFSPNPKIFFPPLGEDEGTEGAIITEAEIRGHCIHRMYVDGGSASEILYEHYFSRLCSKIKNQLVPATTPLIGFNGEIIWPIGQIQLLVTIGDTRFNFDEFCSRKVTIPIQWNYWKARGQEVASGSVNSLWNAKDPGRRRSNHLKK